MPHGSETPLLDEPTDDDDPIPLTALFDRR
jgi:hypothetical protein